MHICTKRAFRREVAPRECALAYSTTTSTYYFSVHSRRLESGAERRGLSGRKIPRTEAPVS
ncbi:hypothetical protein M758_2G004200 [Ceratodon purpureus]|nr:hypothetical protein M758_2G004200 [Ceratodon purpureus]